VNSKQPRATTYGGTRNAMEGAEPGAKVPLAALRILEMIEETKKR